MKNLSISHSWIQISTNKTSTQLCPSTNYLIVTRESRELKQLANNLSLYLQFSDLPKPRSNFIHLLSISNECAMEFNPGSGHRAWRTLAARRLRFTGLSPYPFCFFFFRYRASLCVWELLGGGGTAGIAWGQMAATWMCLVISPQMSNSTAPAFLAPLRRAHRKVKKMSDKMFNCSIPLNRCPEMPSATHSKLLRQTEMNIIASPTVVKHHLILLNQ